MNAPRTERIIRAAAALDTLYGNPQVCAFNRERDAKTPRAKEFWRQVASALHHPYSCQSWMQDEMDTWSSIRAHQARAALGKE